MFELPDAKRVRREDLHASDESSWSESEGDADREAWLNAQIAKALGIDESEFRAPKPQDTLPGPNKPQASDTKEDDGLSSDSESEQNAPADESASNQDAEAEDEAYTFRLFSTAGPAPKVVLENHDRIIEGKLARGRPLSYYLVTDLPPEKKHQYEMAAVSGEDILARSKIREWGLELPWRVTNIKVTRKARPGEGVDVTRVDDEQQAKRKRLGKKSRIAMRKKARAKEQADAAAKQKMADKEEQVKEKKKRLNKLKKARRKAKRKAGKGENGGGDEDSSSDEE
ncbi:hypothetical protein CI102_3693 [Trichoderma harzianum]|uniref:Uncharacterized protein n=1 Tax=Trichoderma harzianum CBS 226.95 TaxID=983964 RepID=A0A2T4A6D9_TRIHA|nr:hypothetical protein M431DRAFT_119711 [Trichoderma harzianum CBS 226.95]PKK51880.1 hypothetical protein CI102_3693 [Trichoderma harzianum]PTB52644.1 hypothetical protein M431DRAFT_119711 [Trichoderma harzianum CBS 226.95]